MTVDTFKKAKELSIMKWRTVLGKLKVVEADSGEWCGFCLLAVHTAELKGSGFKCSHCLVVDLCNTCKHNSAKHLTPYIEFVGQLINQLEFLEEEIKQDAQ